jgi:CheY-like chemotaxis protein
MREEQLDVLVLDPEFDVRAQGSMMIGREVTAMRNAERRRLVFVLLTNTARTGDAHAAFLAGANLVVQMKEVGDLPRVLEKNIRDLNELYRDFNRALGLAEL